MNNFLVDGKIGLETEVDLESGLKKPKIVEPNILGTLLPWVVAPLSCMVSLLGAKSLFNLLRIAKLHRGFFQLVFILEWNGEEKKSFELF